MGRCGRGVHSEILVLHFNRSGKTVLFDFRFLLLQEHSLRIFELKLCNVNSGCKTGLKAKS